jgi:hypothetical protein
MEKIKLVFPEVETEKFEFNGQKIEVDKFASPSQERAIADYAIQTSEGENELIDEDSLPTVASYSKFEYGFIGGVLATMTNIDLDDLNIDSVVSSGLWGEIKSSISNYFDLAVAVEKVYNLRKQEFNLESKLNKLIDNVGEFVEKISKLDLSPENLKLIIEQLGVGKEKLSEVFPDGVVGKSNQIPTTTS